MIRSLIAVASVTLTIAFTCAAQSQDPPAPSDTAKPAASSPAAKSPAPEAKANSSSQDASPEKKKVKKVWTNEEVSRINGHVSVVGEAAPATAPSSGVAENSAKDSPEESSREKMLAGYRDKLRQLRMQLESTDKKLSELQNFKGDNSSASGGINMNQGYSMTPVAEQIKQLEAKKNQIQDQIDAVESDARKNGFSPGDVR